jgi:cytochrome b6-f complex iron-sulfur subunit
MTEADRSPSKANPLDSPFFTRRQFIQLALAGVGAAWAGVLLQLKLFPLETIAQDAHPVVFALAELPVGSAKLLSYAGQNAIVLRTPESIKAFSLVCTHLGCMVQWQESRREFYCPCHDGRFDSFGEAIAGPPTVPLEELPVRVEGDSVIVGELA